MATNIIKCSPDKKHKTSILKRIIDVFYDFNYEFNKRKNESERL